MEDQIAVAWARDEAEAEMIQGLLESEGIPSFQQRTGVNGPMLGIGLLNPGGGSRRIFVTAPRAEEARALLEETSAIAATEAEPVNAIYLAEADGHRPRNYSLLGAYARATAWSLLGLLALAALVMLVHAL